METRCDIRVSQILGHQSEKMKIFLYICALLPLFQTINSHEFEKSIFYHINLNSRIKEITHNVSRYILAKELEILEITGRFHTNISSVLSSYGNETYQALKKKYEAKGAAITGDADLKRNCKKYVDDLLRDNVRYQRLLGGYIDKAVISWTTGLNNLQQKFVAIEKSLRDLEKAGHNCSTLFDKSDWIPSYNCAIKIFHEAKKINREEADAINLMILDLIDSERNALDELHESINNSYITDFYAGKGDAEIVEGFCFT